MSFDEAGPLLKREPRKGMLGMDRKRRRVLRLAEVKGESDVWLLRKLAVVRFVRVNVRMRVGRLGKRMYVLCFGVLYK